MESTLEPTKEKVPSGAALEIEPPGSDLLDDCRMMLRFAVKEGLEPDQSLRHDIAALDNLLLKADLETISEVPAEFLSPGSKISAASMPDEVDPIELLLKVHAGLTKLVAPATPETLRATQPPPGRQRLLGGMPLVVKGTIYAALICLLGFLVTVPKPSNTGNSSPTPSPSASITKTTSSGPSPSPAQPTSSANQQ